jgi:hypothetical protein
LISNRFIKCITLVTLLLIFLPVGTLFAQRSQSSTKAGEQRKAEKGLNDNRYFIYFLNSSVTNYGTDKQRELFTEVVQRDIMSQFFYMKFLFYESYFQIRKSQKQLITLYREILASEIISAKKQLDSYAPEVVTSKDALAKHYLYLGYRETTNTKTEMVMADSYRDSLYSMRLYRYVKAIKRVKEAKKYALFAAVRLKQTPQEKIKQKPITYEEIEQKLPGIAPKDMLDQFRLISADSYYKTTKRSIFDSVWEKPDLDSNEEFRKILNNKD